MKPVSRALLMLALVLGAINLRPGITSLAPLIERIAAELSLSRGLVSLTTALPVLCMGLLAPLAPRLAVRFGLERVIAGCLGLIGLALAARLGSHHSAVLIGSAAALGAGIAIAGPLMSGFIKRHFHDHVGRVVAWYALSMTVGGAAGAVLTDPVVMLAQGGWHLGLAAWAIPAGVAMLLWLYLPNRAEKAEEGGAAGLPWREPRAWLITALFAIQAGLFYALATWLVARYTEAGFSSLRSNSLFSLFMLMGLPSSFILPWLAQRFGNRYHLLLGCGFITTLCLAMITFAPTQVPGLWALLLGLGLSGSFSLAMVLPLYEVNSSLAVSRWTAMMLFAGYSLGSLTPVLAGLGRDLAGNYQVPFMVITGLASLLCVLAWLLGRRRAEARK
ncbi:CynX/NimT family MFS transporter [Pseudomonas sp. ENNP23]|uniref:MFS transporter n=1 Tax=Pseudomonas sp. ENNP23 TaxID=1535636 RepID=UPI00084B3933|nr:MFS transporter [Pseudomonas sp. ENNP23]OEC61204.1 MFS transporter [Pseudomonas sp. ENNP23]